MNLGPFFSMKNPLCIVGRWTSDFSGQNLAKFRQKKKKKIENRQKYWRGYHPSTLQLN